MLTRVTISGADDAVDPKALQALSSEFPFVEWGILYSAKRSGEPRYPSLQWLNTLPTQCWDGRRIQLALHLCGESARNTLDGSGVWLQRVFPSFQRVQVNGYTPPAAGLVLVAQRWTVFEFILQVREEAHLEGAAEDIHAMGHYKRASILFDPSGGRGLEAFRWPTPPPGIRMGYAGGIKPSTVLDVLRDIGPVDASFWIDMESGVRTDDKFDLALVRKVLEQCAPYVEVT